MLKGRLSHTLRPAHRRSAKPTSASPPQDRPCYAGEMADPSSSERQAADGLFRKALALHMAGELEAAAAGYQDAAAASPAHFSAHLNLGVVLRRLGRPAEALASCDRALALNPDAASAHGNRGRVLVDLGRLEDALASYDRAVALKPDDADAHGKRGFVLRQMNRPAEALESYDRAVTTAPDDAASHLARGGALYDLGRLEEALATYDRALALKPDMGEAHWSRAVVLRRLKRLEEAVESLGSAIALQPGDAGLHHSLGGLMEELSRPDAALASHDRAIALRPDFAQAHNGRGTALFALDRPEEALASYDRAISLAPDLALAHRNRGVTLRRLRRPREAVESYDRAIALQPQSAEAYWYRSLCHLVTGRFAEGWRDYERRWEVEEFIKTAAGEASPRIRARFDPTLQREDLAGREVLVVGEQGVGDVVMFASILPDLIATASSVSLVCDRRLWRLFSHAFPTVVLLDAEAATQRLPAFGAVLGIGSLGRFFRNHREDFPGAPYLAPRPEVQARWADRLGPAGGVKRIGVSWRGGLDRTRRSDRSMDLAELAPLLELPGCEFVSLQYGDVGAEAVNATRDRPVRLFPPEEIDDFEDLAGLIQNLDLVISVQTALAHLCGATGTPALVMLPPTPEWRYMAEGATMPWYRSITLERRRDGEGWAPLVDRVGRAVAQRLQLATKPS